MLRSWLLVGTTVVLALACARTGVGVPELPAPAPEPGDAGVVEPPDMGFSTFACRWTIGERFPVARLDTSATALFGAVALDRDEVALLVRGVEARTIQVRGLGRNAPVLREQAADFAPSSSIYAVDDGYLLLEAQPVGVPGCAANLLNRSLAPIGLGAVEVEKPCFGQQTEPGVVTIFDALADAAEVVRVSWSGALEVERRLRAEGVFLRSGTAATTGDEAFVAGVAPNTDLSVIAEVPGGPDDILTVPSNIGAVIGLDVDPVRGGALLLTTPDGNPRRIRIERFGDREPLALEPVASTDDVRLVGALVTNESEALVPLGDGGMLSVNLGSERVEVVPSASGTDEQVNFAIIVLRPGTSRGGILDLRNPEPNVVAADWRPLTCNR